MSRGPAAGEGAARPPLSVVLFCHSLVSDWNHGNAHFLRGICRALIARGHRVQAYEPRDGWSRRHLVAALGEEPLAEFRHAFPDLSIRLYDLATLDLDRALQGADLVLVHEWNAAELVRRLGAHRRAGGRYRLLFHDTHHRSVSEPESLPLADLEPYDGVLAFGAALREEYLAHGWADRVWTWHEAADVTVFRPMRWIRPTADLVWVGNWGDGERGAELAEFLVGPARDLRLRADVYGVRYPEEAFAALAEAGIRYHGWLSNHRVPEAFARHRVTVHIPRKPYVERLPGIPTIRVFEALACGIPLVCSPWRDDEGLFRAGEDYLLVEDGEGMRRAISALLADPAMASELGRHGCATILARHTCGHRAEELLTIHDELAGLPAAAASAREAAREASL